MGMKAEQTILSRLLPKTGQESKYAQGDDGTYEIGWWRGRLIATNLLRFIAKTIAGDDVVIDRATGLMWPAAANASINNLGNVLAWSSGVTFPLGKSFAGFTDWRTPNIFELLSIMNYEQVDPAMYTDFWSNFITGIYWSSTTYATNTLRGVGIDVGTGLIYSFVKTGLKYVICVRGGR